MFIAKLTMNNEEIDKNLAQKFVNEYLMKCYHESKDYIERLSKLKIKIESNEF